MLRRITVVLTGPEREALDQLANLALRAPDDQLRWLLREELLRQGLVETDLSERKGDGVSLETIPEGQV